MLKMENVNFAVKRLMASGNKRTVLVLLSGFILYASSLCAAPDVKQPNVAGAFYPENPQELSRSIDSYIASANPQPVEGDIFALISPHAGYSFSGRVASFGYALIKNKPYKTVIIIGPSHYYPFSGISVYPQGVFKTPLGALEIDSAFTEKLLNKDADITFDPAAFRKEHSVEVQLPFIQKVLSGFKIVPIVMGDCSLSTCQKLSALLKDAIGRRRDVLVIASTDMYHGYEYQETEAIDTRTLSYVKNMDSQGLYSGLREGTLQLCGGFPVVTTLMLAGELGYNKIEVLKYTNSALVTGNMVKGEWTVGYSSSVMYGPVLGVTEKPKRAESEISGAHKGSGKEGESAMLNSTQRKRLIEIARDSIQTYLKTGKKLELTETDPLLLKTMGAFVTLHEHGQLRGCIGTIIGTQPLYLTVRDMAVEAAVGDPRFPPVVANEFKDIDIEISVLSPLERVDSIDKIQLGTHGVLVKQGFRSGVFLPQVATETGWSKEEFLSNLCAHKAGLPVDAWKQSSTEMYVFSAEVFPEKE
jgi:AmmeMemoRadiSam system protein B/AmmeMemoRadiSam system protein A